MANRILILATIKACNEEHPTGWLGRTGLQKICYFGIQLGIPYDLPYEMYFYGPYSPELEEKIRELQVKGLLSDKGPQRYSDYVLTGEGENFLNKEKKSIEKWNSQISALVRALGGLKPALLELLATVQFTSARAKSRQNVISEVRKIKGNKFSEGAINEVYDTLSRAGLISSQHRSC